MDFDKIKKDIHFNMNQDVLTYIESINDNKKLHEILICSYQKSNFVIVEAALDKMTELVSNSDSDSDIVSYIINNNYYTEDNELLLKIKKLKISNELISKWENLIEKNLNVAAYNSYWSSFILEVQSINLQKKLKYNGVKKIVKI